MKRSHQRLLGAGRALLGLGLLAWVLSRAETWRSLGQLLTATWLLPALVGFTLIGAVIESLRLGLLFRSQQMHLSFWNGWRVVALGAFFNFSIPGGTGGDLMKLYYLAAGNRGRRVEVATLLLVDRLVALTSLLAVLFALALADAAFVARTPVVRALVLAALALAAAIVLAVASASSERVRSTRLYARLLGRLPFSSHVRRALDALHRFREHRATLGAAVAISILGHGLLLAIFAASGAVLFADAPPVRVSLLALLGLFANALPLTPGGIGVGEAAFDRLFLLAGYARGSPLILAWRAAQLPFFLAGGLIYVLGVRRDGPLARSLVAAGPRGKAP